MNKIKLIVLCIAAAVVVTACRKNDALINQSTPDYSNKTVAVSSSWRTVSAWKAFRQENSATYSSSISDSLVSSEVVSKGLVLVFKKSGSSIVSLPVEEKGKYSWYYQVATGSIDIIADAGASEKQPGAEETFAYFIITPEKLNSLQNQGYSKVSIMAFTYENAQSVLSK